MYKILFFLFILFVPLSVPAGAESDISDIKEGYDENTELSIRGVVIESLREMRGPILIRLKFREKTYVVITAPPWYLHDANVTFQENSEVEVVGSKYIGRDGNLYIVARELRNPLTGRVITLRDSTYRPLWKGHRMQKRTMP
jgi:hypothetical protein